MTTEYILLLEFLNKNGEITNFISIDHKPSSYEDAKRFADKYPILKNEQISLFVIEKDGDKMILKETEVLKKVHL